MIVIFNFTIFSLTCIYYILFYVYYFLYKNVIIISPLSPTLCKTLFQNYFLIINSQFKCKFSNAIVFLKYFQIFDKHYEQNYVNMTMIKSVFSRVPQCRLRQSEWRRLFSFELLFMAIFFDSLFQAQTKLIQITPFKIEGFNFGQVCQM